MVYGEILLLQKMNVHLWFCNYIVPLAEYWVSVEDGKNFLQVQEAQGNTAAMLVQTAGTPVKL